MFRSGNQVNGTLINKINKYKNDIISLNSKMSYNETNNNMNSEQITGLSNTNEISEQDNELPLITLNFISICQNV